MADARTFAGYAVTGEVGAGTLCTVYRAESAAGRAVAIKALKASILPGSPLAAQLDREAAALAALTHPNIVALLDRTRDARSAWLVLELVDGPSLAEVLAKRPKIGAAAAAAIGAEVARALAHVHQRGWVHRDVKPGNVLLSRRGEVKLVDFGIAERAGDAGSSALDPSFGTPAYMAPEQILGEHADVRSDLFALGVVLYQAVAGVRPFEGRGEDRRAAGQRIRRDPPVPLRRHAPDVPRELERLVLGLLEKHPEDRPQRATAVAERLERIAQRESKRANAAVVRGMLSSAGLPTDEPGEHEIEGVEIDAFTRDVSVKRLALRLAGLAAGAVLAGAVVQGTGRNPREAPGTGDRPLELSPASAGGLRVLASPWAEVVVDGQAVDTTPFARAIPLAPGRHFVALRHPNAPDEMREITVARGEIVTLDVTMRVP